MALGLEFSPTRVCKDLKSCFASITKIVRPKNRWEVIRRELERARRKLNKSRGLPATKDVEIIANMLIQLRAITEERLGDTIEAAVVARPNLPGLTTEDLKDAMEYARIKLLRSYNYQTDVSETSAAFAGLGKGLCSKPEDIEACEAEESEMPLKYILSISFTNTVLGFAFTELTYAHRGTEWISRFYPDMGLDALDRYRNKTTYWTEVTQKIRNFNKYPPYIDHVQVLGEAASNEDFHEALANALKDYRLSQIASASALNASERFEPLSLAARGAAEFAKCFQVMTWDCMEPARCHQGQEITERPIGDL